MDGGTVRGTCGDARGGGVFVDDGGVVTKVFPEQPESMMAMSCLLILVIYDKLLIW